MDTSTDTRRTLTVQQFMDETGARPTKTYAMIASGELPSIRMGRRILISRDTVERWLRGDLDDPYTVADDDTAA